MIPRAYTIFFKAWFPLIFLQALARPVHSYAQNATALRAQLKDVNTKILALIKERAACNDGCYIIRKKSERTVAGMLDNISQNSMIKWAKEEGAVDGCLMQCENTFKQKTRALQSEAETLADKLIALDEKGSSGIQDNTLSRSPEFTKPADLAFSKNKHNDKEDKCKNLRHFKDVTLVNALEKSFKKYDAFREGVLTMKAIQEEVDTDAAKITDGKQAFGLVAWTFKTTADVVALPIEILLSMEKATATTAKLAAIEYVEKIKKEIDSGVFIYDISQSDADQMAEKAVKKGIEETEGKISDKLKKLVPIWELKEDFTTISEWNENIETSKQIINNNTKAAKYQLEKLQNSAKQEQNKIALLTEIQSRLTTVMANVCQSKN